MLLKKKGSPLLASAFTKIIGKEPTIFTTHRLQDRGNCFWKSFSTWMNSQLKGCSLTVSSKMVESSKTKAPYAHEDLEKLEQAKTSLPLSRLMHRIAYEGVRAKLTKLFSKHTPPLVTELKKRKLKFFGFGFPTFGARGKRRKADVYLVSLVEGITKEPAAERYERKRQHRAEETQLKSLFSQIVENWKKLKC